MRITNLSGIYLDNLHSQTKKRLVTGKVVHNRLRKACHHLNNSNDNNDYFDYGVFGFYMEYIICFLPYWSLKVYFTRGCQGKLLFFSMLIGGYFRSGPEQCRQFFFQSYDGSLLSAHALVSLHLIKPIPHRKTYLTWNETEVSRNELKRFWNELWNWLDLGRNCCNLLRVEKRI